MKNNYVRWITWGMVFGLFYSFIKYRNDTAKKIFHTSGEWVLIVMASMFTYVLVVMLIMFILRRRQKDNLS